MNIIKTDFTCSCWKFGHKYAFYCCWGCYFESIVMIGFEKRILMQAGKKRDAFSWVLKNNRKLMKRWVVIFMRANSFHTFGHEQSKHSKRRRFMFTEYINGRWTMFVENNKYNAHKHKRPKKLVFEKWWKLKK